MLLAALCALVLPASSQATPGGSELRFELAAGHGNRLVVVGKGETVTVEVGRPGSLRQNSVPLYRRTAQSSTSYAARGTVTRRRIAASFGKFGGIDMRFRPTGKAIALPARRNCRGVDHFTRQPGIFVGSIRFVGEHRYVVVHKHRVAGAVRGPLRLNCAPSRSRLLAGGELQRPVPQPQGGSHSSLVAVWRHGVDATELYAFVVGHRMLTVAVVEESLGQLAEFHFALSTSPSRILSHDDALTRATLAPPAPFHGKGTYEAAPDGSKRWTGPLSVSFPGAPRWPLAGEQFKVSLGAGL